MNKLSRMLILGIMLISLVAIGIWIGVIVTKHDIEEISNGIVCNQKTARFTTNINITELNNTISYSEGYYTGYGNGVNDTKKLLEMKQYG